MGFRKIAIATDPIQALLVKKHTRDNQTQVHILPFELKSMSRYQKATLPQIPSCYAFVEDFVPLKERSPEVNQIQD